MANYLALLGWSYDAESSLFEVPELIQKFSLEKVSATPAVFDYQKLQWMNGEYMRKRPRKDKTDLVIPHLQRAGLIGLEVDAETREYVGRVVDVVGERLRIGRQIVDLAAFFFKDAVEFAPADREEFLKRHYAPAVFRVLEEKLRVLEVFDVASVEAAMRALAAEMGLKPGDLFQPVRVALTGSRSSPGLFECIAVLGKDRVLARLQAARKAAGP
jgi:glutamyl/glutaminyl-tRNA synthetase